MITNHSILVKNTEIIPNNFSNTNELLSAYQGTYTTCRTLDKYKIVDLPTHIYRLSKVGLSNLIQPQVLGFEQTYEKVMPSVRQVIHHLQGTYHKQQLDVETRLIIVLSLNPSSEMNYDVLVFGENPTSTG